jgi:SAM-dependent methyltransferase
VFVRDVISESDLDKFYSDEQSNDPEDPVYGQDINQENLNYYYLKIKQIILQRINQGKLLDIGCNRGQFLKLMNQEFSVYGVERAEIAYTEANSNFPGRIHHGALADYKTGSSKYDVVTMMDVFDHLIDPASSLKHVHNILADNGLLIIKVHNIDCLLSKISRRNFYALIPPFHLSYFSPDNLRFLLEQNGYKVIAQKFIGNRLSLRTIFYRLAKRQESGLFHLLFRFFSVWPLRKLSIVKNLHDIMTVIAIKQSS